MERYLKCGCGNIVRVLGSVREQKCPRCEIGLWLAEEVTKQEWLGAHGIKIAKEHVGQSYLNKLKTSRQVKL